VCLPEFETVYFQKLTRKTHAGEGRGIFAGGGFMIGSSRLLLLLLLAAPLQAQGRVAYSSLRPTLSGFRFFPSGKDSFPSSERVYRTTFDSATVLNINFELDIDYPKTPAAATFALSCRYQGGPSARTGSHALVGQVGAGWTGSKHAGGWGSLAGKFWKVGTYQVECRDGDIVVASGSFEVTRDQHDIPAVGGMVSRVRVLENPMRLPPVEERKYGSSFDSTSTRYISTEIHVDYPPAAGVRTFPIECTYKFPNGETRNFQIVARVEAAWKDSYHTGGWGNDEPGTWGKGTYQITCRHLDRVILERTFRIT
jgi:hypothetical protein